MDLSEVRHLAQIRLLVRPKPIGGESWGGYLLRLSAANAYRGIQDLGTVLEKTWQAVLGGEPEDVVSQLGISVASQFTGIGFKPNVGAKRDKLFSLGRSQGFKVCPICMAEDKLPYVRADWDGPISHACKRHEVALISHCQECGKHLTYLQSSHLRCECGAEYTKQTPPPIPKSYVDFQLIFAEAFPKHPKGTFEPSTELERHASAICLWLLEPIEPKTGRRKAKTNCKSRELTLNFIDQLASVLCNWPHGALDAASMEIDKGARIPMSFLNRRLLTKEFAQLKKLVKAVEQEIKDDEAIVQANQCHIQVDKRKEFYSLTDLYKLTGIQHAQLKKLCESGEIPKTIVDTTPGIWHPKVEVPEQVYQSIAKAYRDTNDTKESSLLAGCSEDAIRGLISSGCISSYALSSAMSTQRIYPEALEVFRGDLLKLAEFNRQMMNSRQIKFSDWACGPYTPKTAKNWPHILNAIREKKVPLYRSKNQSSNLDDLFLTPADLRRAFDRRLA